MRSARGAEASASPQVTGEGVGTRDDLDFGTEPTDWFTTAEELRRAAAELMGAHVDNLALVPAVSYGVAIAAKNLPIARGQNVVVLAEQFPSNVYAWREAARGVGAELRAVRRDPNDDWTPAVLAGIDDDTAVVAVPGCHWTDGTRVNLAAVGRSARRVGAALVVGRAILSSS